MQLESINPGPDSAMSKILGLVDGSRLYFAADDGKAGTELWYVDAGTTPISQHDLNPGGASSSPSDLVGVANGFVMIADDGVNGPVLWTADNL